ncbi:MAG TPA: alanine-tRNA synthetase second additional domain-containing protein [Candidatus Brocadiia bacterium]|nr:alanine-tRNA synthetase second additional domain-containing protein [Candidatus Brocadiia bacterium]
MRSNVWHECLCFATYYAPRGRPRLLMLGESIGQRYLSPTDHLIGILGEAGTGKSSIINGMFPGLELTNDDEGINVHPAPLVRMHQDGRFSAHTFHIDVRFEMAFVQVYEIAEAIRHALAQRRRIIVEHFDAVYPYLKINAQVLLGIGEDIVVTRPNLFGPFPDDIRRAIENTAVFRRMAHSAEDITSMVLENDFRIPTPDAHSDVPRGFVIEFDQRPPGLDIAKLERKVLEIIERGAEISYDDPAHIRIGDTRYKCTGPRIHVGNSSEIRNFRLMKELVHDPITGQFCLVGQVAEPKPIRFIERHPEAAAPTSPAEP